MGKKDDTYESLEDLLPETSKKKIFLLGLLFVLVAGSLSAYAIKSSASPVNWVAGLIESIKKPSAGPTEGGVVLHNVSPGTNDPSKTGNNPVSSVNEPAQPGEGTDPAAPAETPGTPGTLSSPGTAGTGAVLPATIGPVVIYFDENSAALRTDQLPQLATFYTQVKNLEGTIEIVGYTDNQGRIERGDTLSQQRAEAVAAAIKALDPQHIFALEVKGLGHTNPAGDNNTVLGRQLNRRVEVTFIPKSV